MLGCNRVHGAEIIIFWFEEVISDFNINNKIKHIITDSGSNIKKAFLTLPGYEEDEDHEADNKVEEFEADTVRRQVSPLNTMLVLLTCYS